MLIYPALNDEFSGVDWICPDVSNFKVNNNPWLYDYGAGTNFVMVVNTCT